MKRNGTNRQDGSLGRGSSVGSGAASPEQQTQAAREALESYKKQNEEVAKQVALWRQIAKQRSLPDQLQKLQQSKSSADAKKMASDTLRQAMVIKKVQEVTGSKALGQALLLREALKQGGRAGTVEGFFVMASMIGDSVKFMSQLVREQRHMKMDAIENANVIGGTSEDFQKFAQQMGDWDSKLGLKEGWSRDYYEQLKHLGLKGKEVKLIMDKVHQSMASENLGTDRGSAVAQGFVDLEKQMRERLHHNAKARMGREEIMRYFEGNAPAQKLMFDAMGKQMSFSAEELSTLFGKTIDANMNASIDPEKITSATTRVERALKTWAYGELETMAADFEGIASQVEKGGAGVVFAHYGEEILQSIFGNNDAGMGAALDAQVNSMAMNLEKKFKTIGEQAKSGFQAGIEGLPQVASDSANQVGDKFRAILGIHSPSTVFRYMGNMTGRGFELGINDASPAVNAAMSNLIGSPQLAAPSNTTSVSVTMGDTNVHANSAASGQELGEDLAAAHAARLYQYLSSIAGQLGGTA